MPRKKSTVRRRVERTIAQAPSKQDAVAVLDELREEVAKEAETEKAQSGRPGTILNGQKVLYHYGHAPNGDDPGSGLCAMFPMVTFTPEETIPLTFQGVRVQALAGIEMHVPKPYYDIYTRHRRQPASVKELRAQGFIVDEGMGGLS